MTTPQELQDRNLAYAVLRLTMGINLFLHGYVRIVSGVGAFAEGMAKGFESTPLPQPLVLGFLTVLPYLEAVLGGLMILGLFTRFSVVAGGLLIASLVFGTSLKSEWASVGLQMTYALCFFFLIAHASSNRFSIDHVLRSRKTLGSETT